MNMKNIIYCNSFEFADIIISKKSLYTSAYLYNYYYKFAMVTLRSIFNVVEENHGTR